MATHLGPKFLGEIGDSKGCTEAVKGVCEGIGRNPPNSSYIGLFPALSKVVVPVLLLSIVSAKLDRLLDVHPDNEKGLLGVLLLCSFPELFGIGSGVSEGFFFLKNIDKTPRDFRFSAIESRARELRRI